MKPATLKVLAQTFQTNVAHSLFDSSKVQLIGLVKGAIVATRHLLSLPKYQSSQGLKVLNTQLPLLLSTVQNANLNAWPKFTSQMKELIGQMAFYTFEGNAGTGFDPITNAREEGYSAPSYYIKAIDKIFDDMKDKLEMVDGSKF